MTDFQYFMYFYLTPSLIIYIVWILFHKIANKIRPYEDYQKGNSTSLDIEFGLGLAVAILWPIGLVVAALYVVYLVINYTLESLATKVADSVSNLIKKD